jgi:hypothetical protein
MVLADFAFGADQASFRIGVVVLAVVGDDHRRTERRVMSPAAYWCWSQRHAVSQLREQGRVQEIPDREQQLSAIASEPPRFCLVVSSKSRLIPLSVFLTQLI